MDDVPVLVSVAVRRVGAARGSALRVRVHGDEIASGEVYRVILRPLEDELTAAGGEAR